MSGRHLVVNCGTGRALAEGFAGTDWPVTGIDHSTIEIDDVARHRITRVNVDGRLLTARPAARRLRTIRAGSIVSTTSLLAFLNLAKANEAPAARGNRRSKC